MSDGLRFDVADNVATITLDRPDRLNAATSTMCEHLLSCLEETDRRDDVRAVIFTGAGSAFCAGADLGAAEATFNYSDGGTSLHDIRDLGGQVTLRLFDSVKPLIAAINGPAVGFGATITLPMDYRLIVDGAKVGFVFGARGIVPDGAATWFLPKVVGLPRALDWCLSARLFGADEALASGLVSAVYEPPELLDAAYRLAQNLAANVAPVSAAIIRRALWQMAGAQHPVHANRLESAAIYATGRGADAAEGVRAFLEKRPPKWTLSPTTEIPSWIPWLPAPQFDEFDDAHRNLDEAPSATHATPSD